MAYKMLIDAAHTEETRVVVVDGNRVEEFDFETASRRQLAGNIYLAKVTRVEPSLQAAFVDYGGNRHGFLAFSEIHPDYYQIPVADRKALIEEERALAAKEEEAASRRSRRRAARAETVASDDAVESAPVGAGPKPVAGMEVLDAGDEADHAVQVPEHEADHEAEGEDSDPRPYAAVDHAAEIDDQIESIADEDVTDEIRAPRRPRARRYKIQEVIKVRQILLVQVVKEERGNKGAALTTYLSLAGRYCVLMPNTARGGGISRKITNAADRKKLKEIAGSLTVPDGAGLIVRTAGAKRTKAEIKRDYEYLQRLWDQIRELTLKSIAPAPIYEEGNLIKRSIRDLYSRDIEEVLVEGEAGYRVAKDFMKMIMPSHAKNVRQYTDPMPIFARYQVESYLAGMFNPVVQLKSGGYIVIGITEALVSIDVNSGKATRQGSIEETALQTNLEAADEIARQLRLRDLAGLIVIDFIDMEERKNNAAVEKRLKERLKNDRARIQVGRISGFGLLEMSRQRLRPGMLEATTQPCPHCHGTGLIRSHDSLALAILRQLEEEGTRGRSREVLVRAPVMIANFLINQKRERIGQIEARYGMAVRLEADPSLTSPDFAIEKFKTATRPVQPAAPVVSIDMPGIAEEEGEEEVEVAEEAETAPAEKAATGEGGGKRRRRRRRRRRGAGGEAGGEVGAEANGAAVAADADASDSDAEADADEAEAAPATSVDEAPETPAADAATAEPREEATPAPRKRSRSRRKPPVEAAATAGGDEAVAAADAPAAPEAVAAAGAGPVADPEPAAEAAKPKRRRSRKAEPPAEAEPAAEPAAASAEAPPAEASGGEDAAALLPAEPVAEPSAAPAETAEAETEGAGADEPQTPARRRRGWWSLGR